MLTIEFYLQTANVIVIFIAVITLLLIVARVYWIHSYPNDLLLLPVASFGILILTIFSESFFLVSTDGVMQKIIEPHTSHFFIKFFTYFFLFICVILPGSFYGALKCISEGRL